MISGQSPLKGQFFDPTNQSRLHIKFVVAQAAVPSIAAATPPVALVFRGHRLNGQPMTSVQVSFVEADEADRCLTSDVSDCQRKNRLDISRTYFRILVSHNNLLLSVALIPSLLEMTVALPRVKKVSFKKSSISHVRDGTFFG